MPSISFTQRELEDLSRAIHVADWVANSHAAERAEERLPLDEVRQKIYRARNESELFEPWEEDPVTGEVFEPATWEDESFRKVIDPFVDEETSRRIVEFAADRIFEEWFGKEHLADQPENRSDLLGDIEDAIADGIEAGGSIRFEYEGPLPDKDSFVAE
jgi:hypothetical protein